MGRVLSPNDVLFHYEPWALVRQAEAQNPIIHDPPLSYAPLMSMLKDDPSSFHWNRYVASGIPGFGSAAAAVLSPLIAIPVLLLPLSFAYAGIVALKILVSFFLSYGWLREERLGKRGAAFGSLIFAAAGPYAVWWLWQGTNATVLYPAVLWVLARLFHRKRNSVTLSILVVTALLLSGFPATIAYIAYLAAAYLIYGCLRYRVFPARELGKATVAMLVGALISAPLISPFISFLQRSGHIDIRERAGYDFHYPLDHLRAFLEPYYLGDPVSHFWKGDWRLAINNSFIEASVYVGILTLLFVALSIAAKRASNRWFWLGVLAFLLFCMFGDHNAIKDSIGKLPGFRPTPMTRLRVLMPLPVAYLAAAGFAWLTSLRIPRPSLRQILTPQRIALVLGLIAVVDLARFAGRFYPFVEPSFTTPPDTPTLQFLRSQPQPFRIAPFFNYLWPNSAELVRLEDIRSHFGSEEIYRELIKRFDPESWGGAVTVITFNGLRVNIADGILGFLGVRYLIEQPNIDILHWRVLEQTEMSGTPTGEFPLNAGQTMTRELFVEPQMHSIDVNFGVARSFGRAAGVQVELVRPETGEVVYSRRWKADRLAREPKVYLPVSPYATAGNVLLLRATAHSMNALVPTTATGFLYGKVRTPVIPFEELPDGRIFQNVAELPRHWAVWNVRQAPLHAPADFAQEALVSEAPSDSLKNLAKVTPWMRRVQMRLREYSGSRQILETKSEVPFLLSTSEKLTPELAISIDGKRADAIPINGMFAAVRVSPGQHRIELTRRIGRGWWPGFVLGLTALLSIAAFEVRRVREGKFAQA